MRVLILGANGFIGSAVADGLIRAGHDVVALGRNIAAAAIRQPGAEWRSVDIATLTTSQSWGEQLRNVEAVVNCAGALQDGLRDNVAAVQDQAMRALYEAGGKLGIGLVIQISANTSGAAAESAFLTTKRSADEALARSGLNFVILRPAVVIGRNAHGGSALLRGLAAVPLFAPLVHAGSGIRFVALDDVVRAVIASLAGEILPGSDVDIAAPETVALRDAVARHRAWMGLPPVPSVTIPGWIAKPISGLADILGWLGWRSPLRTTAMQAAAGGISAGAGSLPFPLKTLDETLNRYPAGVQDLWFARLYMLKPVVVGILALFWTFSGLIAVARFDTSTGHLTGVGIPPFGAALLTITTSLADMALGIGVMYRRTTRFCLVAMIVVASAYLLAATVLQPALWLDPLGPLLKVLPSIALAAVALAIFEER